MKIPLVAAEAVAPTRVGSAGLRPRAGARGVLCWAGRRDARRGKIDVVIVWACDRLARSTRHFLEVLDEFTNLKVEFVSFGENIDTSGPPGGAIVVIIGAIAELERNLIIERVRAGMRRAKLEGRHIGRPRLSIDRAAIVHDRTRGMSLT